MMRVEDNNMSTIGASGPNRTQAADGIERKPGAGPNGSSGAGGLDQVSLSTLTERLQGLSAHLEAAGDGSPSREARLAELSALAGSGNYDPGADALSGTLIEEMLAQQF